MTAAPFSAHRDPGPATVPRASKHPRWVVLAARVIMAGIFIYASLDKIAHPAAFAKDVYNYQILPDALINLTALVLPWLELLLGLCLLTGIWLTGAVLSANGLLILFLAALVFNLTRGLDVSCGCFSTASNAPEMFAGWYLMRDVGFLAVGIFLFYAVLRHLIVASKAIWGRAARQILALVILSTVAAVAVNALRPDHMPLVGDWSVAARITTDTGERIDISLDEAEKLFATYAAVFIDARSEEEYTRGHIQNARCLPWQAVDLKFMAVTEELDLEMPIVTYCDGETCELSHHLALFLRDAGFLNTRVLVNGWTLWQQAGLPAESGTPRDGG